MSVSSLDTPVSNPLPPERVQANATAQPEAKASRPGLSTLSFNGQHAANVNFSPLANPSGPVFGRHPAPALHHGHAGHSAHPHGTPAPTSVMHQFSHWMSQWWGGQRPPVHPGCGSAPPRPMPGDCAPARPHPVGGRPYPSPSYGIDPGYANKSREQLAQQLLDNFDAFKDRGNAGYVSVNSIREMAKKGWSHDPVMNQNIRLAKELLRRPELVDAIDRHRSTAALDGLINRQKLGMVISDTNFFKYNSDKQLAQEMLEHFDALKGRGWGRDLKLSDLRALAGQSLTGDSPKSHLIQLAREILRRGDVLKTMDNLAGRDNDGRISRKALLLLSR